MNAPVNASHDEIRDKYVARLRARLARPKITVEDARDGILDCFVSTYHEGVKQGLKGIIGVNANPDQVAQVTGRMFRDRLKKRGISFDNPNVDALQDVKEELDKEFHFHELPAEVSATHDQVCSLLLAKADGLIEHGGDRSVLGQRKAAVADTAQVEPRTSISRPVSAPRVVVPVDRTGTTAASVPPPPATSVTSPSPVIASLRQAFASYVDEIRRVSDEADPAELIERLDRARTLAQSIADFSRPTGV